MEITVTIKYNSESGIFWFVAQINNYGSTSLISISKNNNFEMRLCASMCVGACVCGCARAFGAEPAPWDLITAHRIIENGELIIIFRRLFIIIIYSHYT
jgi:hypothetical protein